ncbi:MAG TPA: PBP1A family penicillin-binding protein [Polyangia bacterium]|nr:PBP1A family penicillin-binding protein [Polyangia bacterium]
MPERKRWKVWAKRLIQGTLLGLGAGVLSLGLLFLWMAHDPNVPNISRLSDYRPKLVTRIYGASGELIGELAQEKRTFVKLDKISKTLQQAVVDAEDAEFYEHGGVSYWGMLRAFLKNLRPGGGMQGGSTITQQVVKNLLLTPERKFKRKIQEIYLAYRLESSLTKDEILELYINLNNYGHGRYGCEEAARFYFAKSCADIDLAQAALLAGLPQSPARLDPLHHPEAAKRRQIYVLEQMIRRGHAKPEAAQRIEHEPIKIVRASERQATLAAEVIDLVRQALVEKYGEDKVWSLGVDVKTTIDGHLQELARQSLEQGLIALDAREGFAKPLRHLDGRKRDAQVAALRKELGGQPPKTGSVYEALVSAVDDKANAVEVNLGGLAGLLPLADDHRYNPKKLAASKRFRPGDVIRVRPTGERRGEAYLFIPEFGPQAAMVVIAPETREIKAIVGGYSFVPGSYNRALRAHRQPGSSFKPFLYATAFDSRKYTPASLVNDAPEVYQLWKPQNDEKEQFRGPVRLRIAVADSINTVAIRVMSDIGTAAVIDTARKLGIKSELTTDLSLALGASGVTPLEMANAYSTFPSGGKYAEPVLIKEIAGAAQPIQPPSEVLKPEVAFLMTQVLTSVIQEGTARAAASQIHRPAAGKTGTTNSHRDAWFIGFTPDLCAAVWVGFDDMRQLGRGEQGARAALPIWTSFMVQALKNQPPRPFVQPSGVVVQRIDPKTGLLAPPGATTAIDEYFLDGTAPTQVAPQDGDSTENFLLHQAAGN